MEISDGCLAGWRAGRVGRSLTHWGHLPSLTRCGALELRDAWVQLAFLTVFPAAKSTKGRRPGYIRKISDRKVLEYWWRVWIPEGDALFTQYIAAKLKMVVIPYQTIPIVTLCHISSMSSPYIRYINIGAPQGHRPVARNSPPDFAIDPTPEDDVQKVSDEEASSQVSTKGIPLTFIVHTTIASEHGAQRVFL